MSNDYLEKFQKEFKEKLNEFDKELIEARTISRDVIYKIILLCSTIIGFSFTLISIPQFTSKIIVPTLQISWYIFLCTIALGFLSLFLEGRIKYALKWRSFQVQEYDENFKYSKIDKIKVLIICIYSLFFPRNFIFCRIYKSAIEKKYNALLNSKAVILLAELEKIPFFLENLFIISFISGLFVFIKSYN